MFNETVYVAKHRVHFDSAAKTLTVHRSAGLRFLDIGATLSFVKPNSVSPA